MILQEIYLHNRRQSWKIIVDASDVLACVLLWRGVGVWIGGVGHHLVEADAPESECILLRILLRGSGDAYHFRAFESVLFLIIQTA